jgi:hypothetical protein
MAANHPWSVISGNPPKPDAVRLQLGGLQNAAFGGRGVIAAIGRQHDADDCLRPISGRSVARGNFLISVASSRWECIVRWFFVGARDAKFLNCVPHPIGDRDLEGVAEK